MTWIVSIYYIYTHPYYNSFLSVYCCYYFILNKLVCLRIIFHYYPSHWTVAVLISSTVSSLSPSASPATLMTRSTRVSCSLWEPRPRTEPRAARSSAFKICNFYWRACCKCKIMQNLWYFSISIDIKCCQLWGADLSITICVQPGHYSK